MLILALNEESNLRQLLPAIRAAFRPSHTESEYEIIIVDGGSKDQTVKVALDNHAKVIKQSLPGYGNAFREGLLACQRERILTLDADFSHPPEFISDFLNKSLDSDITIASRFISGSSFTSSPLRVLLSKILSLTTRVLFCLPIKDISSGYRVYRTSSIKDINLKGLNFDVLVELLVKAHRKGVRISEIPFSYSSRRHGYSHVKFFNFAITYAKTFISLLSKRD